MAAGARLPLPGLQESLADKDARPAAPRFVPQHCASGNTTRFGDARRGVSVPRVSERRNLFCVAAWRRARATATDHATQSTFTGQTCSDVQLARSGAAQQVLRRQRVRGRSEDGDLVACERRRYNIMIKRKKNILCYSTDHGAPHGARSIRDPIHAGDARAPTLHATTSRRPLRALAAHDERAVGRAGSHRRIPSPDRKMSGVVHVRWCPRGVQLGGGPRAEVKLSGRGVYFRKHQTRQLR